MSLIALGVTGLGAAAGGGLLGATALGLAGGSALAGAAGGLALGAGIKGAIGSGNAQNAATQAGNAAQINIDQLNEQIKAIAKQNAEDSAALEKAMTPEVPALRQAANQGLLNSLGNNGTMDASTSFLMNGLGGQLQTPLLQAAIARAQQNLALGGNLDTETQNMVTRRALATAGGIAGPGGGLGLGRDVTARDLGLTSLQLAQQRLQDATQLGGLEQGGAQFDANNLINRIQLLRAISDSGFNKQLSAAQYGQSIAQPLVGLDPSSAANIAIGNQNALGAASANRANIAGANANSWLNLAGNTLGYGLLGQNKNPYVPTPKPTVTTPGFEGIFLNR